ncbi:hypothetical protein pb186bvf_013249 [Paramecium bursaria]
MIIVIKNFQFTPDLIDVPLNQEVIVKIGENSNRSQIYHQRYFILTIAKDDQDEEIESQPLYQNDQFKYQFQQRGTYYIKCVNGVPIKVKVLVQQSEKKYKQKPEIKKPDPYAFDKRFMRGIQNVPMAGNYIQEFKDIIDDYTQLIGLETNSTFNSSYNPLQDWEDDVEQNWSNKIVQIIQNQQPEQIVLQTNNLGQTILEYLQNEFLLETINFHK